MSLGRDGPNRETGLGLRQVTSSRRMYKMQNLPILSDSLFACVSSWLLDLHGEDTHHQVKRHVAGPPCISRAGPGIQTGVSRLQDRLRVLNQSSLFEQDLGRKTYADAIQTTVVVIDVLYGTLFH